jgi:hypothetical protein
MGKKTLSHLLPFPTNLLLSVKSWNVTLVAYLSKVNVYLFTKVKTKTTTFLTLVRSISQNVKILLPRQTKNFTKSNVNTKNPKPMSTKLRQLPLFPMEELMTWTKSPETDTVDKQQQKPKQRSKRTGLPYENPAHPPPGALPAKGPPEANKKTM